MGEKYRLEAVCENCPFDGIVHLEEGVELEEKDCPNCGEKQLSEPELSFD